MMQTGWWTGLKTRWLKDTAHVLTSVQMCRSPQICLLCPVPLSFASHFPFILSEATPSLLNWNLRMGTRMAFSSHSHKDMKLFTKGKWKYARAQKRVEIEFHKVVKWIKEMRNEIRFEIFNCQRTVNGADNKEK